MEPYTKKECIYPKCEQFKGVNWIKINNKHYQPGEMVQFQQNPIEYAEIISCLRFDTQYLFEISVYSVLSFSKHFQAHSIIKANTPNKYVTDTEFKSNPTCMHHIQNKMYIRTKCY